MQRSVEINEKFGEGVNAMFLGNKYSKVILLLSILMLPTLSFADYYKVTVSKKGENLYEVQGQGIYIVTRMCIELALWDDAILELDASGRGKIMFPNSNSSCDVEKILR
ncbi:MAG: hypothetical protein ACHQJ6_05385 [Candidatus Berkiellales bacterium]